MPIHPIHDVNSICYVVMLKIELDLITAWLKSLAFIELLVSYSVKFQKDYLMIRFFGFKFLKFFFGLLKNSIISNQILSKTTFLFLLMMFLFLPTCDTQCVSFDNEESNNNIK